VGNSCDTVANIEKQPICEQKEAFLSAQETLCSKSRILGQFSSLPEMLRRQLF
jgi:hypothetical protein